MLQKHPTNFLNTDVVKCVNGQLETTSQTGMVSPDRNHIPAVDFRSEDPNQHLKDFLKLMESLDLDDENKERTCCIIYFPLRDQASNWLERLPAGSITTWEDLTTCFLAQFFPSGRTAKLRIDILMFQQHLGGILSEA
ncbi:zinc finger, CCHC-type containing protein [Tanacetum coccineum]